MFYAVEYKSKLIGVLDTDDNSIEYYDPDAIKEFIKLGIEIYGITLAEDSNPMFTVNGLVINLYYLRSTQVGQFKVALLVPDDRWGKTFRTIVNAPTLAFFDTSTSLSKKEYPSGQYISSYYLETLLSHNSGLILNAEVPDWKISASDINSIKEWASYTWNKYQTECTIQFCDSYETDTLNDNELYRASVSYFVNNSRAYMMGILYKDGTTNSYNMDDDCYYDLDNDRASSEIPKDILQSLQNLTEAQVIKDYKSGKRT